MFESLLEKYGLKLDDDWNKEALPHQGKHPIAYHEDVYEKALFIDEIADGDAELFKEYFEIMVKGSVRNNTSMLYSEYWKNQQGIGSLGVIYVPI